LSVALEPDARKWICPLTAHEGIIAETRCILQVQIITRGG